MGGKLFGKILTLFCPSFRTKKKSNLFFLSSNILYNLFPRIAVTFVCALDHTGLQHEYQGKMEKKHGLLVPEKWWQEDIRNIDTLFIHCKAHLSLDEIRC